MLATFRLSNRTPKIAHLKLYQANAPTLTQHNFLTHIIKGVILDTHILQIF